ncbi:MAG: hypothetical protein ACJ8G3_16405 [Burkholderiaceae bacterium]
MHIGLRSIFFCMGLAALSQIAAAAGAPVGNASVAQEQAERYEKPGKQRNNSEKKAARLQSTPAASSYEQDLATVSAQADAAEAACASQPGDNQQACRKQVAADRERATVAIRKKHEQGARKN